MQGGGIRGSFRHDPDIGVMLKDVFAGQIHPVKCFQLLFLTGEKRRQTIG